LKEADFDWRLGKSEEEVSHGGTEARGRKGRKGVLLGERKGVV
jgi:hypothetical protein